MDDLFEQLKAAPPVNKNMRLLPKSTSGKKIMARPSLQYTNRLSPRRESMPSTSSSIRLQKLSKDNKSRSMSPPQFSNPIKQIRPFKVLIGRKSLSSANNTPVKGGVKKNPVLTAATIKTTDKKALCDSIRSSRSSQVPNVTANTPTKAQKKQFIATTMPSMLPKSRREETRKQKPTQLNKKKLATKRCVVRLPQKNLKRLQKQLQGKGLNEKEPPIKKLPANPTKSKEIQKRKSLGVEKSPPSASLNSTLARIVSVSNSPFIKSDRSSISSIPKRGRVSDPPTPKAGSLPNLSTPNRSGSVSSKPSSKNVSLQNSPSKRGLLSSSSLSKRGRLSNSPSKRDLLSSSSLSKRGRLSSSPSKRGRLSNSPPSKRGRLSNSPPSKRGRLSNSPTSKQNRSSSTSPSKAQTGFYIKINPTPSSLLRLQKSKEKKVDKSQTKHQSKLQNKKPPSASTGQNMKISPTSRTKATKFTRTQLIKAFGKRVFQSHVRIERCRHPLMVIFDSNARARKTQAKRNKSKTLSVSFREQVEILGSTDTDEESIDVENDTPKVFSFGKTSAPSPSIANTVPAATTEATIRQSTLIVTPARLKKVENGKVIDDIEFDPAQFILPNAVNQSVAITGYSSTPYSAGYKKRERKSFSPLKGDSISPRREEFKLANEKLPPSGLRRFKIDDIDEDDEDDCEYIVPIDVPQRHTSHVISVAADESSGSFVSATDEPTVDSKTDSSHVTDEIFQSPLRNNKDNDKPSMQDNDAPVDLVKNVGDLGIPKLTRIQESPTVVDVDWNKVCAAIVSEDQLTKNVNLYDSKEGETTTTATTTSTTNNSTSSEDNALSTVNVSSMEVVDEEASKDEDVIDKLLNESLDDITAKDFELPSLSVKDDVIMITDDIIEEISPKDFELPPLIVHDLELSSLGIQDVATKVSEEEVITNARTTLGETCLH